METRLSDQLTLLQRVKAPTPKFFRTLKAIGLAMAAVSGVLLTAPVSLPAIVTTIAGYIATAGLVATAVSQVTVEEKVDQPAEQQATTESPDWEIGD